MKKIILPVLAAVFALLSTACGKPDMDAVERLSQMDSYTAEAEVHYITNKSEDVFDTVQYAKRDGRYCIETLAPEKYKGTSLVYDGKMVWQKTDGTDKRIKISSQSRERALLILYSFLENHNRSMENAAVTTSSVKGDDCTVLEAVIPGENKFLSSEKLWISNESGAPKRLVIYTEDGREKIVVNFSGFRYNEVIDDEKFTIR